MIVLFFFFFLQKYGNKCGTFSIVVADCIDRSWEGAITCLLVSRFFYFYIGPTNIQKSCRLRLWHPLLDQSPIWRGLVDSMFAHQSGSMRSNLTVAKVHRTDTYVDTDFLFFIFIPNRY